MKRISIGGYIFISFVLHLFSAIVIDYINIPITKTKQETPTKIKIRITEPEDIDDLRGSIIDIPMSNDMGRPLKKIFLSRVDSKGYSKIEDKKSEEYRDTKTVIPQKKLSPPSSKDKILRSKISKEEEISLEDTKKLPNNGRSHLLIEGIDNEEYPRINYEKEDEGSDEELISLDTQKFKYVDYFTSIKEQVVEAWSYPIEAMMKGMRGKGLLRITISKEGRLIDIQVVNTSGYEILDDAAVKAFKKASPYKPMPDTINKEKLTIIAPFAYTASFNVLK